MTEEVDLQERKNMHGEGYAQAFMNHKQILRVARLLDRAQFDTEMDVLDIGCGTGALAGLIAPKVQSYSGVDFSEAMIHRAKESNESFTNCRFYCADAVELMQQSPATWDAIFMLDISEHVPDTEWREIVQASWQALKPGGKVYLHTPNLDFFIERFKDVGLMRQFPEHIAVRNEQDNMRFFEVAGFGTVKCFNLAHYNILRHLHPLSYLPFIGRYFSARLWVVASK